MSFYFDFFGENSGGSFRVNHCNSMTYFSPFLSCLIVLRLGVNEGCCCCMLTPLLKTNQAEARESKSTRVGRFMRYSFLRNLYSISGVTVKLDVVHLSQR